MLVDINHVANVQANSQTDLIILWLPFISLKQGLLNTNRARNTFYCTVELNKEKITGGFYLTSTILQEYRPENGAMCFKEANGLCLIFLSKGTVSDDVSEHNG
jgi:hypothetical protein